MLHTLKKRLYFVVAAYFAFWAKFVLRRWRPRVIIVTGSSGKTTVLHMVEAQLGDRAIYSHHANSAIGLPFDILGLEPNVPSKLDWVKYVLVAPFKIWRALPKQKIYVAEADCDRPNEGKFISQLLRPEVTIWVSVFRTHSMNFDSLVAAGKFKSPEEAIAYEFGYFAANTSKLLIINADQPLIMSQLQRVSSTVKVVEVHEAAVSSFAIEDKTTLYKLADQEVRLTGLHPKELGNSVQMVRSLLDYLSLPFDPVFKNFHTPPGRSNVLAGKNNSIIIDSTYNTGLGAMSVILDLFGQYPHQPKWLVMGDILEQGNVEQEEHEKLAAKILTLKFDRIVLLGPRIQKYTYPILKQNLGEATVVSFETPKQVLDYLTQNLKGSEALLFKGARGLEGVIEQLLANPADEAQLVRRGAAWTKRRQAWGLPK